MLQRTLANFVRMVYVYTRCSVRYAQFSCPKTLLRYPRMLHCLSVMEQFVPPEEKPGPPMLFIILCGLK